MAPAGARGAPCRRAGYVYAICGNLSTMPGLPSHPAAERIDVASTPGQIGGAALRSHGPGPAMYRTRGGHEQPSCQLFLCLDVLNRRLTCSLYFVSVEAGTRLAHRSSVAGFMMAPTSAPK